MVAFHYSLFSNSKLRGCRCQGNERRVGGGSGAVGCQRSVPGGSPVDAEGEPECGLIRGEGNVDAGCSLHAALGDGPAWRNIGIRIDQDRLHMVEVLPVKPKHQQGDLRGDGDSHFVVDLQATATLPMLFGYHDSYRALQSRLLCRR